MKKLLTAILILVSMVAQGQFVTIPDFNFRQKLFQLYPSCFNSSGQLDTTCPSIVSALSLIVPNENISNLDGVQYFDSLIILSCESNNLTTLPPIANTIKEFSCSNNNLLSLPSLPDSLMNLYCDSNQLASLPTLPDSLEFLNWPN